MEDLKQEIANMRTVLTVKAPMFYFFVNYCNIKYNGETDQIGYSYDNSIVLTQTWSKLPKQEKLFVFLHELMHILLNHTIRIKQYPNSTLFNIAADFIINNVLSEDFGFSKPTTFSPVFKIPVKAEWKTESAEEIANRMLSEANELLNEMKKELKSAGYFESNNPQEGQSDSDEQNKQHLYGDIKSKEPSKEGKEGKEETIEKGQIGDKDVKDNLEKSLNRALHDSLVFSKTAGKMNSFTDRIFQELTESKIPWNRKLRNVLNYRGSSVISTWKRLPRRDPNISPIIRYSIPTIWILVDVSGSISPKEFNQFTSEIFYAQKKTKTTVNVMFWDTKVTSKFYKVKSIPEKVKGGGGTKLLPALNELVKDPKFNRRDIVVILSDWDLYDNTESYKFLQKMPNEKIFVTTLQTPKTVSKSTVINI